MRWRLLDTFGERRSGAWNMAADRAVLAEVEAGNSPPTIRLYGWNPPCISLGHSQNAERELDSAAVAALGYEVVRRPTGGRAVLHIGELTYSVIAPFDAAPWCGSQAESYRAVSLALSRALGAGGLALSLEKGYPVEKPAHLRAMTPCFSSTARSEVVWGGRKVVGSAQRRFRRAFLQHGSILVSEGHRRIVDCLRLEPERRGEYLDILDRNAISLERIAGRPLKAEALAEGFLFRFAAELGVAGGPGGLTAEESSRIADLLAGDSRPLADAFEVRNA